MGLVCILYLSLFPIFNDLQPFWYGLQVNFYTEHRHFIESSLVRHCLVYSRWNGLEHWLHVKDKNRQSNPTLRFEFSRAEYQLFLPNSRGPRRQNYQSLFSQKSHLSPRSRSTQIGLELVSLSSAPQFYLLLQPNPTNIRNKDPNCIQREIVLIPDCGLLCPSH